MRRAAVLLAFLLPALAGCSRSTSEIKAEEGYSLAAYRKVAVPAFDDPRGQGADVAKALRDMLRALPHGVCDEAIVDKVMTESQKQASDAEGAGLEQLERLRFQAGADAIVMGRMAPDWSSASVLVYETELGDVMLRGVVRPRDKARKAFSSPEEVAGAVLIALAGQR